MCLFFSFLFFPGVGKIAMDSTHEQCSLMNYLLHMDVPGLTDQQALTYICSRGSLVDLPGMTDNGGAIIKENQGALYYQDNLMIMIKHLQVNQILVLNKPNQT